MLLSGTRTTFVNDEQTDQVTFSTPGRGLSTVPCTATTQFLDEEGNTVRHRGAGCCEPLYKFAQSCVIVAARPGVARLGPTTSGGDV